MRKIKIFIFTLIILLGFGFIFRNEILDFYSGLALKLPEIEKEIGQFLPPTTEKEVSLPPPLQAEKEYPQASLSAEGVIRWTNTQREKYGLPPLKESDLLDASAAIKVEDMFENQYFDHYSPSGEDVGDLAKIVNYEFILIGENLALGNFKDDEDLINAWMESQGHRENILNERYQEIGVAVKKGIFEGRETWLAVQHFGFPLSACPQPEEELKVEIEENKKEIDDIESALNNLKNEIRRMRPRWGSEYQAKVNEYNLLLVEYNSLVTKTQTLILDYNNQVKSFNQCVSSN